MDFYLPRLSLFRVSAVQDDNAVDVDRKARGMDAPEKWAQSMDPLGYQRFRDQKYSG